MNLKVEINGKIYETLVQGNTFSDELGEVLDSGTIIIDHVEKMDIDVFNDVFIFNEDRTFYKHLLVDQFTEEIINFTDNIYNYKIQLFSETKGLETIQLPNISITQPLNVNEKTTAYEYLCQFIGLYSPKIKVMQKDESNTWYFSPKYTIDPQLEKVFGNIYTPDFTLTNPNLRDVLSKIMIIKDMIPVVKDGVVTGMDLSKRNGEFNINLGEVSYISSSKTSSNYCDNLKTTYINALTQNKTAKMVEYLGFRNSDTALMKIEDLRIETRFPIYKINKVLMCYYKKVTLNNPVEEGYPETKEKAFLCKQDITELVKLNSERNYLSLDWDDFNSNNPPKNIKELSKYRMATIGYDIGSNHITGWGEMYTFPKFVWDINRTYIENIFRFVDTFTPFGIYNYDYIKKTINEGGYRISMSNGDLNSIVSPFGLQDTTLLGGTALKLKSFFFVVEYEAFFNGTVVHSKDTAKGNITINDNQSSSLSILELDGIAQKEKINRFGNKGYVIPVRYKNIDELQELGSVLNNFDGDNDIIIYHREYSIFDNEILCTYYGMKDYVLKNYFTSVYAKHRPYNLMSYGESIRRSENKRKILLLSKKENYYDGEETLKFFDTDFLKKFFSAFQTSIKPIKIDDFINNDKINYGYMTAKVPIYDEEENFTGNYTSQEKMYVSDLNSFVSGTSLCFNISMYDNVSSGVYISKKQPFDEEDSSFKDVIKNYLGFTKSEYSGSKQSWHMMVNPVTGGIEQMGFYVSHIDSSSNFLDEVIEEENISSINDIYNNKLLKLPLIDESYYQETNKIGNSYSIKKDNKEVIDMTFQYEVISKDEDVIITPWLLKLSNFYGEYNKWEEDFSVTDYESSKIKMITTLWSENAIGASPYPWTILSVYNDTLGELYEGMPIQQEFSFDTETNWSGNDYVVQYKFEGKKIKQIIYDNNTGLIDKIVLLGNQQIKYDPEIIGEGSYNISTINDVELVLYNLEKWAEITKDTRNEHFQIYYNRDPNFTWFSNIYWVNNGYGQPQTEHSDIIFYDENNDRQKLTYLAYADNGKKYVDGSNSNELFSENNANFYPLNVYNKDGINFDNLGHMNYPKNMFIKYSKEKIQKHSAYDQYKYNEFSVEDTYNVEECFKVQKDSKNRHYIYIPGNVLLPGYSSIQFWYLDGTKSILNKSVDYSKSYYNLVFAVNYTEEDIERNGIKIYISELNSLDTNVYLSTKGNLAGKVTNFATEEKVVDKSFIPK